MVLLARRCVFRPPRNDKTNDGAVDAIAFLRPALQFALHFLRQLSQGRIAPRFIEIVVGKAKSLTGPESEYGIFPGFEKSEVNVAV